MNVKPLLAAAVLVAGGAGAVLAAERACTPAERKAAEKAADMVVNWPQLHKVFRDYGHCDEGTAAELFTEALLRCLVEWKNVDGLARPMDEDRPYRAFVLRHLADAAKEDREAVYSRAKMTCPKGMDGFCTDLIGAVKPMQPLQMIPLGGAAPQSPAGSPEKK